MQKTSVYLNAAEQLILNRVKLGGKIDIYLMRVDETAGLIPERIQLLPAVFLNLGYGW